MKGEIWRRKWKQVLQVHIVNSYKSWTKEEGEEEAENFLWKNQRDDFKTIVTRIRGKMINHLR